MVSLIEYLTSEQYPSIEDANLAWLMGRVPTEMKAAAIKPPSFNLPNVDLNGPSIDLPKIGAPTINPPSVGMPSLPTPALPGMPGVPMPNPQMPQINLPTVQLPEMPNIGLPQGPQFGLPSINLPMPELPYLGDYQSLPGAIAPAIGLKDGQVTFNPSPGQAVDIGGKLGSALQGANLPFLSQVGSGLSSIAGMLSPLLPYLAVAPVVEGIYNTLMGVKPDRNYVNEGYNVYNQVVADINSGKANWQDVAQMMSFQGGGLGNLIGTPEYEALSDWVISQRDPAGYAQKQAAKTATQNMAMSEKNSQMAQGTIAQQGGLGSIIEKAIAEAKAAQAKRSG